MRRVFSNAARCSMPERIFQTLYPEYDVLEKFHTPSWNAQAREVVGRRLHEVSGRRFRTELQWKTLHAVAERVISQPERSEPVPIVPWIDPKVSEGRGDGTRDAAWSEIGIGGPPSPRGYVRLAANRRDPSEGDEADPRASAGGEASMSLAPDPKREPRAIDGRAPDVFKPDGWVPMRQFDDADEVDFVIVGTGAGAATLAAKLAEAGFRVVGLDAGPFWRPLQGFASDEKEQNKLYGLQDRVSGGEHPIEFGANNSGCAVGGSTVHFRMVVLRGRPEWFSSRSKLGYGRDWPIAWQEMWRYYGEVENALKVSGPVRYPGDPGVGGEDSGQHDHNGRARGTLDKHGLVRNGPEIAKRV